MTPHGLAWFRDRELWWWRAPVCLGSRHWLAKHCWRTMVAFHRPSQSRNKTALTRVYLTGLGTVPQKETNENSAAAPE